MKLKGRTQTFKHDLQGAQPHGREARLDFVLAELHARDVLLREGLIVEDLTNVEEDIDNLPLDDVVHISQAVWSLLDGVGVEVAGGDRNLKLLRGALGEEGEHNLEAACPLGVPKARSLGEENLWGVGEGEKISERVET